MSRDSSLGLTFAGIMYYDGQGFMVHKSLGVKGVKELDGATVCVQTGTTNELNLADYFTTQQLTYKPVVFERLDEIDAGLQGRPLRRSHHRHVGASYSERTALPKPDDHVILPEIISQGAAGAGGAPGRRPVGGHRTWVHFAMLNAEEAGRDADERRPRC